MYFAIAEYENGVYRPNRANAIIGYNFPVWQAQRCSYGYQANVNYIINQFLGAIGGVIKA